MSPTGWPVGPPRGRTTRRTVCQGRRSVGLTELPASRSPRGSDSIPRETPAPPYQATTPPDHLAVQTRGCQVGAGGLRDVPHPRAAEIRNPPRGLVQSEARRDLTRVDRLRRHSLRHDQHRSFASVATVCSTRSWNCTTDAGCIGGRGNDGDRLDFHHDDVKPSRLSRRRRGSNAQTRRPVVGCGPPRWSEYDHRWLTRPRRWHRPRPRCRLGPAALPHPAPSVDPRP